MANNFRVAGDFYYSKAGHDSNDGLTPDTPKKTISGAAASIAVIGSGVYNSASITSASLIVGDGTVIFDFLNSVTTQSLITNGNPVTNIIAKNGIVRLDNAGITGYGGVNKVTVIDCTVDGSNLDEFVKQAKFINCIMDTEVNVRSGGSAIFINTNYSTRTVLISIFDTYIDFNSSVVYNGTSTPTQVRNSNIQGVIIVGGNSYAIQDQLIGTPQDNGYAGGVEWLTEAQLTSDGYGGTISGWDAAVATCINRDPKFNDASKLDFTLQADSPHIGRAFDGFSNIGGTEYSQSFYAGISNPNVLKLEADVDIDDISNPNDWVLESLSTQGVVRAIVKISDTDEEVGPVNYIGNYSFNSDETGGTSGNFNVSDSKPISDDYPVFDQTTGDAANDTSVVIAGHSYITGQWLKAEGQYREIDSVDANTLFFLTAVRAIVLSGTDVQVGSFSSLASLNPNRLNMQMRSSKIVVNSGNWDNSVTWDNDGLAASGNYLAQEWNSQPMIDNLNGVGFGDDNYDAAFGNPIQAKYLDILIYLRDDYRS